MNMLTIYLLRHGQTAYNADNNRYGGRTDIPLTATGIQQAEEVRTLLQDVHFDGVFASPLQRAKNTAAIASGRDVTTDPRLIEGDWGTWEHKTREEFVAEDPASWEAWDIDPGNTQAGRTGETGNAIVARVDDFFKELVQVHTNGNFMVVGHNGVNRLYMAYKLGMPLKNYRQLTQYNSSITKFTLDENGLFTLECLNAVSR
jgi:alpha-ribazole phosphatase/probable phosphoglycerate mutase